MYKVAAAHDKHHNYRFFLNGNRVLGHKTPADLGFDAASDVIDVFVEQSSD
jgi:hypothetical protein